MPSEKDGVMIILSSPSGAGKTTLVKKLSEKDNFEISISHTTRQPRPNENQNEDYFFVDELEFRRLIKNGYSELFNKCENLLIPTTPELPFKLKNNLEDPLKMYLSDLFTVPINLAGIASLNIPAGFSSDNLPIGLQLVSNSFKEETLFSLAHILGEEEIFEAN